MAGIKRRADQMEMLNRPELALEVGLIPDDRDRALISFLYLTGARISEVLGTMKRMTNGSVVEVQPLKKESIEILEAQDLILVHNVASLKRRDKIPRRTIPIIMSEEKPFLKHFLPYYESLMPGMALFDITRQRAWQILKKELNLFTHYLIHERCTHLVVNKNFSEIHLQRFRGWANTQMAANYSHLNYSDLTEKMR